MPHHYFHPEYLYDHTHQPNESQPDMFCEFHYHSNYIWNQKKAESKLIATNQWVRQTKFFLL